MTEHGAGLLGIGGRSSDQARFASIPKQPTLPTPATRTTNSRADAVARMPSSRFRSAPIPTALSFAEIPRPSATPRIYHSASPAQSFEAAIDSFYASELEHGYDTDNEGPDFESSASTCTNLSTITEESEPFTSEEQPLVFSSAATAIPVPDTSVSRPGSAWINRRLSVGV